MDCAEGTQSYEEQGRVVAHARKKGASGAMKTEMMVVEEQFCFILLQGIASARVVAAQRLLSWIGEGAWK